VPPIYILREKVRNVYMDATALTQAISSLGFPIVACAALGWYFVKTQKDDRETISKLSDAINNNTLATTKLTDKIDVCCGRR